MLTRAYSYSIVGCHKCFAAINQVFLFLVNSQVLQWDKWKSGRFSFYFYGVLLNVFFRCFWEIW